MATAVTSESHCGPHRRPGLNPERANGQAHELIFSRARNVARRVAVAEGNNIGYTHTHIHFFG